MPELAIEAAALAGPYPERADDPRESADRQLWRGLGALAWSARRAARDGRRFLAQVGVAATGLDSGGDTGLPLLVAEEPVEALGLQPEEVGDLERLKDLGE